jgi:hypothetical protein
MEGISQRMEGISQSRPFNETTSLEILDAYASVFFRPIGLKTIGPTHSKNLQWKPVRGEFQLTPPWVSEIARDSVLSTDKIADSHKR